MHLLIYWLIIHDFWSAESLDPRSNVNIIWSGLVWSGVYVSFLLIVILSLSGTGRVAGWWQAWWRATVNLCQQAGPDDSYISLWTGREPQSAHNQGSHVAGPGLLGHVCRRSAGNIHTLVPFCTPLTNHSAQHQCTAWILFLDLIQSLNRLHLHLLFIHLPRLGRLC